MDKVLFEKLDMFQKKMVVGETMSRGGILVVNQKVYLFKGALYEKKRYKATEVIITNVTKFDDSDFDLYDYIWTNKAYESFVIRNKRTQYNKYSNKVKREMKKITLC